MKPDVFVAAPGLQGMLDVLLTNLPEQARESHPSVVLTLVERVAQYRQFPITLCPMVLPDEEQFGSWLHGRDSDYIFFEKRTARVHQEHIIVHELAHMLLGHKTYTVTPTSFANPHILLRALRRSSVEEEQAEALATFIQEVIVKRVGLRALTHAASTPIWSNLIIGLGVVDD